MNPPSGVISPLTGKVFHRRLENFMENFEAENLQKNKNIESHQNFTSS